jgi:hypothetical protein
VTRKSSEVWASIEDKLLSSCVVAKNGCWIYTMSLTRDGGYGVFLWDSERYLAHRLAYQLGVDPIPDSRMRVLHTCDCPACCNPDHLFLGSDLDNVLDMHSKCRAADKSGENNGQAILNEDKVRQIRHLLKDGKLSCDEIAEQFGVTRSAIGFIKSGRTWKHVQSEEAVA